MKINMAEQELDLMEEQVRYRKLCIIGSKWIREDLVCTIAVFTKTHWSEDRGQWIWGRTSENWKSRSPTGFWFLSNFLWYTLGGL
jgi:hypothetical protein